MGSGASSSAAVTQEFETTVINRSTINTLNKMVNTTAVNTLIQSVKNCSSTIVNSQRIVFKKFTAGGDIDINVSQNQSAWLNLSCAQRDEVKNDVITSMIDTITQALNSSTSQDVINKLNAEASSKSEEGWLTMPWGGASSDSSVNQKIKTYVENKKETNIQNVIENAVYANFTNSSYDECISKIINSQEIEAENLDAGGSIRFTANQEQAATLISECIQEANVTNRAVNDITRFLGIKIKEDVTQSTIIEAEAESKATAKKEGVPMWSSSLSSIFLIIVVLIGAFLIYKFFLSGKGSGGQQFQQFMPAMTPSIMSYSSTVG